MSDATQTPLQQLLVSEYDNLKKRLRHRLGSEARASEVLHETYLRLSRLDAAGPVQSPKAYLLRVALNVAATGRRAESRAENRLLTQFEVEGLLGGAAPPADPSRIAEGRFDLEALQKAIDELPERRRAILLASRMEQVPHEEIARRYGVSTRTIVKELKLALEHCADRLDRKSTQRPVPRPTEPSSDA